MSISDTSIAQEWQMVHFQDVRHISFTSVCDQDVLTSKEQEENDQLSLSLGELCPSVLASSGSDDVKDSPKEKQDS